MKTSIKLVLTGSMGVILIIFSCGRGSSSGQETANSQKSTTNFWGKVACGFQLSLSLDREMYRVGEPMTATVKLRNSSDQSQGIGESNPEADFDVVVKDDNGKDVPRSAYWKQLQEDPQSYRDFMAKMKSGEEMKYTMTISKLFNMRTKGLYSISVKRKVLISGGGDICEVISNTVLVRITD